MSTDEKQSVTLNFKMGWIGAGIYIAIGILYHLMSGDGPFMWSDPWLYVTMFMWPLFLLGWVIAVILVIVAVCLAIYWWDETKTRRNREANAKRRREAYEESRRAAAKATPPEGN